MEESNQKKQKRKITNMLGDEGGYLALIEMLDAVKAGHMNKMVSRPKGGFYEVAMDDLLSRGACCAVEEIKMMLDGLRAEAIDVPPTNQTQ